MTPFLLAERARVTTAKWVLWGYVATAGIGATLHLIESSSRHHPIKWLYMVVFLLIGGAAGIALLYLRRSLEYSIQGFSWAAFVSIALLFICEINATRGYESVAYIFHVGIFTVGLILGFRPAIRLGVATAILLLIVSVIYGKYGGLVTASVLACIVALPAKVVEILITESTQELTKMNDQLRQEIVEREKVQAELREHKDHLEELVAKRTADLTAANEDLTARNEELDAFAHTVAHDLKSPLATLIGFSSLLEGRYQRMDEEQRHYAFSSITNMGRRINNIVHELLLLSSVRRLEDLALDPVNMAAVTQEATQRLDDMIAEYHADIVFPETWPSVWSYAPWLEEVWTNYISNAIKYGGNPGTGIRPRVELGFSLSGSQNSSSAAPSDRQQTIMFWVHDNGKGLTPEDQARLFTPFTRLEQARARGHGLVLSIVKRIVERLGGEVGVTSDVQGSTFYFVLPYYQFYDVG